MTGAGTVKCDNPSLTARRGDVVVGAPVRLIVDRDGDSPVVSKVLNGSLPGNTIWIVPPQKINELQSKIPGKGVQLLPCPVKGPGFDLEHLMKTLGTDHHIESILLEGGPTLAFSMLEAGQVDKVMVFVAPVLIGGQSAPAALGGPGFARLSDAPRLKNRSIRKIGVDVLIQGYPEIH